MLKYLITVTEDLAVLAILLGLLYAYIPGEFGPRGKRTLNAGVVAGFIVAVVYAYLKNKTKIIDRSGGNSVWNMRVFWLSLGTLLLFLITSVHPLRRLCGRVGEGAALAATGLLTFALVFYPLPDVLAYPFIVKQATDSMLSTDFIYRLTGYLLGLALVLLIFLAILRASRYLKKGVVHGLLIAALLLNGFQLLVKLLQIMYTKRYISGKALFALIRSVSNKSDWFIYGAMLIALLIPLAQWLRKRGVKEPWSNAAEHRRIRARWRSLRRWSATLACCFALVVLCLTWFTAIDNRPIQLSPVEECEMHDDACWVPLTQVDDGALHRFEYTTPNGIGVRFIVIRKPNSNAAGVGLDACDICGQTGYYQRGTQVICKLCDVPMNINTIGFKGGCNPIVIDYSVVDGFIIVPFEGLIANESEFKG